jgi:hypothetical protein
MFVIQKYTDGPAFKGNTSKNCNQENRHITRYTSHGFHHLKCSIQDYRTEHYECICTLCNLPITERYHLNLHLESETSLTKFISTLIKDNEYRGYDN